MSNGMDKTDWKSVSQNALSWCTFGFCQDPEVSAEPEALL